MSNPRTPLSHCRSFPYMASPQAEVLILGSMPGRKSLEEKQYYAHPQNLFWDIVENSFGIDRKLKYQKRLARLTKCRIALWDVAFQCQRNGSLDAAIRTESVVPNDFKTFFERHPMIHTVLFNGQKAEELFKKQVLKNLGTLSQKLRWIRLPSTSPAHAGLTRKQKQTQWRQYLGLVRNQ